MVWNIRREETSHLIFSIAGSPPESPSANPPGAGTIGFETEYQVGHYVPPDIFIGVPASLLLRACYPRPCLVLSDISRREPLETAASLYTKPLEDDPVPGDYTIFMAQSRRVGKDSKGEPVFALDEKGSATSELDEDLTQIAEAYKTFRDIGTFTESETCFTAERGELDDNLNLNPQHYSPELNATLEKSQQIRRQTRLVGHHHRPTRQEHPHLHGATMELTKPRRRRPKRHDESDTVSHRQRSVGAATNDRQMV